MGHTAPLSPTAKKFQCGLEETDPHRLNRTNEQSRSKLDADVSTVKRMGKQPGYVPPTITTEGPVSRETKGGRIENANVMRISNEGQNRVTKPKVARIAKASQVLTQVDSARLVRQTTIKEYAGTRINGGSIGNGPRYDDKFKAEGDELKERALRVATDTEEKAQRISHKGKGTQAISGLSNPSVLISKGDSPRPFRKRARKIDD